LFYCNLFLILFYLILSGIITIRLSQIKMEFFNEHNILINQSIFDYEYKMCDYHYIYDYIYNYVKEFDPNNNLSSTSGFILLIMIYFVIINLIISCFMYMNKVNNTYDEVSEDIVNGSTCLKVPNVFNMVAKTHFNTDINICLTYAGKLSLGRYLSKQVVRKDISIMYLTDKDPITKKNFRFLRYTKDDYQNMKTATLQWILSKEDKWSTYFAY
jgi:hypothetical protein